MNCVRCGHTLREDATFCTNCGLPTAPPGAEAQAPVPSLLSDPTLLPGAVSSPAAPAGAADPAYDPTVAARSPSQAAYGSAPGHPVVASAPGSSPYGVPLDAQTIRAAAPGSIPYGVPPTAPGSIPYGVPPTAPGSVPYGAPLPPPGSLPYGPTIYGAPSQAFTGSLPYGALFAPPPPPAPPLTLRIFGPDADAVAARPNTRIQALALRNLPLNYVVSKWFMGAAGALIALAVGLILTLIAQTLLGSSLSGAFDISDTAFVGSIGALVKSLLNPNVLNFFAMEHQVTLTLHIVSGSQTSDQTYSFPVLGLLLVPALALTLGGYLAASSDFHRQPRYSIARGALIGPFYAILLLILALLSSTTLNNSDLGLPSSSTATLSPSVLQECLFGLLWGTLFGALGGWIQLTGNRFLAGALPTLQTLRNGRVAGALAGAVVTLICGILLLTAFEFAYIAYQAVNGAGIVNQQTSAAPGTGFDTWTALRLVLTFGPAAAIWLFALGTGAPINTASTFSGSGLSTGNSNTSLGFINATHPGNNLVYLLILAPVICYLIGGRIAARVARAQRTNDAFTAGALIAAPLSVLIWLATLLVPISITGSGGGTNATTTIGPNPGGTFLAVLIAGAIVGGIGGASALTAPQLGTLPRMLLTPLRPLGRLLSRLLDRFTARPANEPRSEATLWLYDSALLVVILAVIALLLIPLAPALAPALAGTSFSVIRGVNAWVAALLVGLPLFFLIGALVATFSAPQAAPIAQSMAAPGPQASASLAMMPGSSPIMVPAAQPFPAGPPAYGTGLLAPGMPGAPGSQPFPSGVLPGTPGSQPFPPTVSSQPFAPDMPGSQPLAPGSGGIVSPDAPTARSAQFYPPEEPPGTGGTPPPAQ